MKFSNIEMIITRKRTCPEFNILFRNPKTELWNSANLGKPELEAQHVEIRPNTIFLHTGLKKELVHFGEAVLFPQRLKTTFLFFKQSGPKGPEEWTKNVDFSLFEDNDATKALLHYFSSFSPLWILSAFSWNCYYLHIMRVSIVYTVYHLQQLGN